MTRRLVDWPWDLHGWGEIAAFLKVSERTAHRWHTQGMPVHRLPSGAIVAESRRVTEWALGIDSDHGDSICQ